MKNKLLIICTLFFISLNSCQKEELSMIPDQQMAELTADQMVLRENLNETALLVTQVAAIKDVQKEIYDAVNMRYEGKNRIMFSHLLNSDGGIKSRSKNNFLTGSFRDHFSKAVANCKGSSDDSFDVVKFVMENKIEIAWHYTQEWNFDEIPAITFNPLDNDSLNTGYKVYYGETGDLLVDTIMIDDNYAFEHPVWIIDKHESIPEEDPNADTFIGEIEENVNDDLTKSNPDGSAKYNKVFVYQVRTYKDNFRGLFGGENEMYFQRAGSEVVLGTDNVFSTLVVIDRWAGRKEVWRTPNVVWDENWQPEEVTQWLGVEAVNVAKEKVRKKSGEVSLKLEAVYTPGSSGKIEIKPSVNIKLFGWEITIKRVNQLWYDKPKARDQFFVDNWRDAARYGTKDGRCVYLAGNPDRRDGVFFTMDVSAYNSN